MIRFLLLLIVFALGLAVAVVTQGTLYHLRLALPGQLPGWTQGLPDDTGLRAGVVPVEPGGVLPPLKLSWRARMPGTDGLHWDLRLSGDGIEITGVLVLAYWPERAVATDLRGTVELDRMPVPAVGPVGLLSIEAGEIQVAKILETPEFTGNLEAELRGVRVAGAEFGQGPVTGTLAADGVWRLDGTLTGGVSPVTARLDGTLAARTATMDLVVEDGQHLPDQVRGVLASLGQPSGQGWRITAEVPLF